MKPSTSARIALAALSCSGLTVALRPSSTAPSEVAVLDEVVEVRHRRPNNHPLHPCGYPFPPPPSPAIERAIRNAAAEFGVNPQLMLDIAAGETGFNPNLRNPKRIRGGNATGLFQHLDGYWKDRVRAFNRKHRDRKVSAHIYNVESQSRVTAFMLKGGMGKVGKRAWRC